MPPLRGSLNCHWRAAQGHQRLAAFRAVRLALPFGLLLFIKREAKPRAGISYWLAGEASLTARKAAEPQ